MNYNDLYSGFKSLFSECTDELHALAQASDVDETDGMHIMFSFVVVPFVLNLLKNDDNGNDNDKLIRAFNYFEEMASSDSADVTEVLEFTVIENLMSNGRSNYMV
jgi:hypothetical protein